MTGIEKLIEKVRPLAEQVSALYGEAMRRYEPEVDAIVRNGSCDVKRIEQVLDRLLDFGDDETCKRLFNRLCRHYWTIDKVAVAEYVRIYREQWGSATTAGTETTSPPSFRTLKQLSPDDLFSNSGRKLRAISAPRFCFTAEPRFPIRRPSLPG